MKSGWIEVVARRLGPPILTTGDEVRFNCWRPDCGDHPDTKYHLYVNPRRGRFFCQRCQRGGRLEWLARMIGVEVPEDSLLMWEQLMHEFLWGTSTDEEMDYIVLPREYNEMMPGLEAHRYMIERGVSDKKIAFYQIGFGTGYLKNRIIFPDVDEYGKLVYWVARKYGKLDNNEKAPKYKNADIPRKRQVYNLGRLLQRGWNRRIVICEGPISANVAGFDAVATYGKYVTGDQVSRLVAVGACEYVIAFDGDALLEGVSLATRLFRRGLNVKLVKFRYNEDPASVGGQEMRRRICVAPRWHNMSALEVLV